MNKKTPIEIMIDMLLEKYDLELFEEFEIGFKNEDGSFETPDIRDDRSWRFTNEELQYKEGSKTVYRQTQRRMMKGKEKHEKEYDGDIVVPVLHHAFRLLFKREINRRHR